MSESGEVLEAARMAAVNRWYEAQPHVGESYARAAADAAMRSLLTGLRGARQHAPGEQPGEIVLVVPVFVIDSLLEELADE